MADKREYVASAEGEKPIFAKVKCPHCKEDIEIVIVGMALLPSNSEVIKFEMIWMEK